MHFREDNHEDKQQLFDEVAEADNKTKDVSVFYMDYVNGRMVKSRLSWNDIGVFLPEAEDDNTRLDYQSWCEKFNGVREVYNEAFRLVAML